MAKRQFEELAKLHLDKHGKDVVNKSVATFRAKANKIKNPIKKIKSSTRRKTPSIKIGQMYQFVYDPKWKNTPQLPYYDKFPLIIAVNLLQDGWQGLNFHYLPIHLRLRLLSALFDITNNNRFDDTTKMQVSYSVLKSASKYRDFKATFKRYLGNHVRSEFFMWESYEWVSALYLPTAQFVGANKSKVWADSRDINFKG